MTNNANSHNKTVIKYNDNIDSDHFNNKLKTKKLLGSVALVGRVNVGKSSLFNKLTRSKRAIVSQKAGCTRDRIYGYFEHKNNYIELIDCGGFDSSFETINKLLIKNIKKHKNTNIKIDGINKYTSNNLKGDLQKLSNPQDLYIKQSIQAFLKADLILFICDGKHGLNYLDQLLFQMIKTHFKPYLIAISKIDNYLQYSCDKWDFAKLFAKDHKNIIEYSSTTSLGIDDLKHKLFSSLKEINHKKSNDAEYKDIKNFKSYEKDKSNEPLRITLIGKPNSGKSSIFNKLIGFERSCVSSKSGTTRDSIDHITQFNDQKYNLIDTAGVRKRTKISDSLEKTCVSICLKNIKDTKISILIIDATLSITDQDSKLINFCLKHYKALIIAVNKWDLIKNKKVNSTEIYKKNLQVKHLSNLKYIPIVFVSATQNIRINKLYDLSNKVDNMSSSRISTPKLNNVLIEITQTKPHPIIKAFQKRIKFYYITQIDVYPVTFLIKTNFKRSLINQNYLNYLTKNLRSKLNLNYVPIKIIIKDKASDQKNSSETDLNL